MSYTMICALFNVLGIYTAKHIELPHIIMISTAGVIILLLSGIFRKRLHIPLAIAFIMLSVGGTLYNFSNIDKVYNAFADKYVTVRGTVISPTMRTSGNYGNKYRGPIPIYTALMISAFVCEKT